MIADTIPFHMAPPRTIKVHARGEDFRIVQLVGNLLVCSKAHGNCCCGWEEKGRAPVSLDLYQREWEQRKIRNQVHLTFTGCLGPCAVGNNALLQLFGRSLWFKDLNDDRLIPAIFDYIGAMLRAGRVVPPPPNLPSICTIATCRHTMVKALHRGRAPRTMARAWSGSTPCA